jgi:hypothetical protein
VYELVKNNTNWIPLFDSVSEFLATNRPKFISQPILSSYISRNTNIHLIASITNSSGINTCYNTCLYQVFWDVTTRRLVNSYRLPAATKCLHLQHQNFSCTSVSTRIYRHVVTSQKSLIFINTYVGTSTIANPNVLTFRKTSIKCDWF